jgi:hypothetical protein
MAAIAAGTGGSGRSAAADVALANLRVQVATSRTLDPPPSVLAATATQPPPTASTAAPAAAVAAPAAPSAAARLLPFGKGMWLHQLSMAGNNAQAVVAQAKATDLTHVYLRLGSSKSGFYDQDELNRLLPAAHAAGIKVIGWDFPYLFDPAGDAARAKQEIDYTTPDGHRIDGFSADVETQAEGVNVSPQTAGAYGAELRRLAGPDYPLIATVPRTPRSGYPYAQLIPHFDAVAPMIYWMNNDPVALVINSIESLQGLGKPIMPVGQAYDGALDHGPPGAPSKADLERFQQAAAAHGAIGFSYWVWHLATPDEWAAIAGDHQFELTPMVAGPNDPGRVAFLQRILNASGVPTGVDGRFGESTRGAVLAVQKRLGLAPTGDLDLGTISALFRVR